MCCGRRSALISFGPAFLQRLHELGWNEDRNVAIEYWWAEERAERFAEIANGSDLRGKQDRRHALIEISPLFKCDSATLSFYASRQESRLYGTD